MFRVLLIYGIGIGEFFSLSFSFSFLFHREDPGGGGKQETIFKLETLVRPPSPFPPLLRFPLGTIGIWAGFAVSPPCFVANRVELGFVCLSFVSPSVEISPSRLLASRLFPTLLSPFPSSVFVKQASRAHRGSAFFLSCSSVATKRKTKEPAGAYDPGRTSISPIGNTGPSCCLKPQSLPTNEGL